MNALSEFALETYFTKWEFTARYHLSASDAQTIEVRELLALASDDERDRWEHLTLGYIPTFGTLALREAIAATYESIAPDDVLACAGANEGLFCALSALLNAQDHAIVVTPAYQALEEVPRSRCDVSGIALDESCGWQLDLDAVEATVRSNTRAIVVNFPNNPTGKVLDRASFDRLIAIAAKRELYIFSDEVYRGIERSADLMLPHMADAYERGISLGVMSKAYGLPGLRVGWVACRDRSLLARMEKIKHYLSICNSAPSELLASIALNARTTLLERNRALANRNLNLLDGFFKRRRETFRSYSPEGACIVFPQYLGDDGVDAFCEKLVTGAGILLLPGSVYRSALTAVPADRLRFGFGRSNMPEALAALDDYLARR